MLTEKQTRDIVKVFGSSVNEGRSIEDIIRDGDLPRLKGATVTRGKVSDSVLSDDLVTKDNRPIRLMYRANRISTHDQKRGGIPFKDQVLASNHAHMLELVKDVLGTSQFGIPGLRPSSTVIASENLSLFMIENVMRMYMAESTTSTSLYQHWLRAKEQGLEKFIFSGHEMDTKSLEPNERLPYLMDTPSTKDKRDMTISPEYLFENGICTPQQYSQIRNSSMMAFGIVSQYLKERGMILVDTKTEHGTDKDGHILSADELYTMDSSRFWKTDDKGNILKEQGKPVSFSKEFARGMKREGKYFSSEQADDIAVRYIQGLQHLTQEEFVPDLRPREERVIDSTNKILDYLL